MQKLVRKNKLLTKLLQNMLIVIDVDTAHRKRTRLIKIPTCVCKIS